MLRDMAAWLSVATALAVTPTATWAQCGAGCDRPISNTQVRTSYQNKTMVRAHNVTRYRDVDNTKHVTHTRRIVTVTRVQPVTRVHVVTRVHNRTKILRINQRRFVTGRDLREAGETSRLAMSKNGDRVNTTYRYRTVRPIRYVTRYRDVYRTRYVTRVTYRGTPAKMRSTVSVKVVTRIQNRTAARNGNAKVAMAQPTTVSKVAPRVQLAALNGVLP